MKDQYWCVFFESGHPASWTVSCARSISIKKFVDGGVWGWAKYYKRGNRCRKVRIVPVEQGGQP